MPHWTLDLAWWVVAVEIPALAGLFVMTWRARQDAAQRMDEMDHRVDMGLGQAREALAAYKLEVAKSYATVGTLKDVERRLTEHLIRIEAKLDAVNNRAA